MEIQLTESNKNLTTILDSIPIGIRIVSIDDGKLVYANRASMEIFGCTDFERDVDGRSAFDFMPEMQPNGRTTLDMANEFLSAEKAAMDFQCFKLDGKPFTARISSCTINYMGKLSSLAIVEDITDKNKMLEEIRRAEIAEERNKAKSIFLATMSHEIRTPMNSIMGFTELALSSPEIDTVPQLKDYLDKIEDSTKWLLRIVNDILDISKIESGKMELDKTPFDLHDIFMRCQSVILPDVNEKGLELKVYNESVPGKKLIGDSLRLYQSLLNLLSNAVKFSDSGIIKLSSLVKNIEENKAAIYFEVKDTGIGMDSEQIDKIFAPFIQVDSSATRNYGGTGLGLTITKKIVELMGGKLSVESYPGMGSTFSFEIEFDTTDSVATDSVDDTAESKKLNVVKRPHFKGLILICEDNLLNQQVICGQLAKVGLGTVVATNGKTGVEKVKERLQNGEPPFDLILMDVFMPVMDGVEAAQKITALNTGTPIVALTANVMVNELDKYKKHGMNCCLGKPFTTQELWHILLKYLDPVSISVVEKNQLEAEESELLSVLKCNFVKSNQTAYNNIKKAAMDGDIKLAKRLAHTLKSNAGQIGEHGLREAALRIENGEWGMEDMEVLKAELELVLEKLSPMLQETVSTQTAALGEEKIRELIGKIEPMLISHNPQCMDMLGEIRSIPGPVTEELVQQIEDFEFKQAAITLEKLKSDICVK